MIEKYLTNIEIKSINDDERSFVAWATKSSLDRQDEEIDANGWELKNYKNNPVIPLFHDYGQFPVAKALWVKPDPKDKPIGLLFKPQFAETELGVEAYYLYKNGYMNAFSVGFDPLEWESGGQTYSKAKDGSFDIWQKDFIQKKKRKPRCKFIKQELLEISGVVVPAHPEALVEARAFVKNPLLKSYLNNIEKQMATPDQISRIWSKALEIQEIMKETESDMGYVLINPDRIELSNRDSEASPIYLGHEPSNKKEIDASEFEDDDFIEDDQDDVLDFIDVDDVALDFIEG